MLNHLSFNFNIHIFKLRRIDKIMQLLWNKYLKQKTFDTVTFSQSSDSKISILFINKRYNDSQPDVRPP